MISVEEALARVLALSPVLPAEEVALRAARGRWLARPVAARLTQPPFDASAMDGYAVTGEVAPGMQFAVVGEAAAGRGFAGRIGAGEAARIFTGAPLPAGADRVVIQEDVTREGEEITIGPRPDAARHVRPRGQDFAEGAEFAAPRRLGPADLGLLAAMGHASLPCRRRPVVAFIQTGDELVAPGTMPGPDQIVASSAHALAALAEGEGAIARLLPIAPDRIEDLRAVLDLATDADLIVTLGGASVGDHDLIGRHAGDLGLTLDFWKIAIRPGKPMIAGRRGAQPLLGLPGNPVSAHVCATLFLLPLLRAMQGDPDPAPRPSLAPVASDLAANGPRRHYMRATLGTDGRITPAVSQDSALTSVLAASNALLIRPEGDPARPEGTKVPWLPLP